MSDTVIWSRDEDFAGAVSYIADWLDGELDYAMRGMEIDRDEAIDQFAEEYGLRRELLVELRQYTSWPNGGAA